MMFQPEVKITKTDNGYVLEWRDERPNEGRAVLEEVFRKTRGVEVFSDRKKLLKRVEALL